MRIARAPRSRAASASAAAGLCRQNTRTPVPPGELDPDLARALGIDERKAKPKMRAT
jgi:hypothetical protein